MAIRNDPSLEQVPPQVVMLLDSVQRLLSKGRTFADDLLNEARVGVEARAPPDLEAIIADAVILSGLTPHALTVSDLPEGLWGRPMALTQIVTNLLANASRHADADHPRVHIAGRRMPRRAWLIVDDNGDGIPSGDRDRVFLPGESEVDSGLGLATVKRQVGTLGGRVWADDSDTLGGARIVVELPAREDRGGAAQPNSTGRPT